MNAKSKFLLLLCRVHVHKIGMYYASEIELDVYAAEENTFNSIQFISIMHVPEIVNRAYCIGILYIQSYRRETNYNKYCSSINIHYWIAAVWVLDDTVYIQWFIAHCCWSVYEKPHFTFRSALIAIDCPIDVIIQPFRCRTATAFDSSSQTQVNACTSAESDFVKSIRNRSMLPFAWKKKQ